MRKIACALIVGLSLYSIQAVAQIGPSTTGPSNYGNGSGSADGPSSNTYDQQKSDLLFLEAVSKQRTNLLKKETKDQMLQRAKAAVQGLGLSCDVTDAEAASVNKITANGQTINAETYEVACGNGLGYFVVAQDPQPPVGYSCFAIAGRRAAAVAKGEKFDEACVLAANQDLKVMAGTAMAHAGTTCSVGKLQWVGQDSASKAEYDEIQCADGKGYMLTTAMPGNAVATVVHSCAESAALNVPCQMTATVASTQSPALTATYSAGKPTLETFKVYIASQGIKCAATNVRAIGKENVQKRHVVEFQCPEYPKGLVAFVPLEDSNAKFETLDCDAAKKVGAVCKFTP